MNNKRIMAVKKEALFRFGDNHFIGFKPLEDGIDYRNIIQDYVADRECSLNFRFVNPSGVRNDEKELKSYFTIIRPGTDWADYKAYLFSKSVTVRPKIEGVDKSYLLNRKDKVDSIVLDDSVYLMDAKEARRINGKTLDVAAERAINSKVRLPDPGTFNCVGFINYDEGPSANSFGIMYFAYSNPDKKRPSGRQTRVLDLDLKSKVGVIELEKLVKGSEKELPQVDELSILIFDSLKNRIFKDSSKNLPNSF